MQTLRVKIEDMLPGDVIERTNRNGVNALVLRVNIDPRGLTEAFILRSDGVAALFYPPGHYKVYRPEHRVPGEADATPQTGYVCEGRHCAGRAYAHRHRNGFPAHANG